MRLASLVTVIAAVLGAACSSPSLPEVPEGADAALVEGRSVFEARCRSCHGSDGSGGTGPDLRGVEERFPDAADQIELVAEGRGSMPGWDGALSPAEIEAVVRFTREVL